MDTKNRSEECLKEIAFNPSIPFQERKDFINSIMNPTGDWNVGKSYQS